MDSGNVQRDAIGSDETQENENVSQDLDAMYVKLISSDNHVFIIRRENAMMSGTIKTMLTGPENSVERQTNVIRFPRIDSHYLRIVCEYFEYRRRYENSSEDIPHFPISREDLIILLLVSAYLKC